MHQTHDVPTSITCSAPWESRTTMSLARAFYTGVTKRTSTFALAIIVGAFAFERTIDWGIDYVWETHNKGKLWKDLKHKYE